MTAISPMATGRPAAGRRWLRPAGYLAFLVLGALTAFWSIYAQFSTYDDEGYVLISLREFLSGHALYTHVYSQYGPFPYELWGALYSIIGGQITPDNARLVVIAVWLLASLTIGVAVDRLSGSAVCGLISTLVGFTTAAVYVNEPMIPDGLATLLMVLILAAGALLAGHARARAATVGALVGALLLTKINIGGSVLLAVCFAVAACAPGLESRPTVRRVFVVLGVIMPFALMALDLDQGWAEDLALLIAGGVIAIELVQPRRPALLRGGVVDPVWFIGGLVLALVVVVAVIIALGTSPAGLVRGVLIKPLGQRGAFSLAAPIGSFTLDLAAVGVVVALAVRSLRGVSIGPALSGTLRVLVGVVMLLWASSTFPVTITPNPTTLAFTIPFVWLVTCPPRAGERPEHRFTRLLMAAVPVFGAVSIYPVAGSQLGYAYVPFIPAAAVILADGALQLRERLAASSRPALLSVTHLAGLGLLAVLTLQLLIQPTITTGKAYAKLTPIPFAGVTHVRQPTPTAAGYADLVHVLRTRCTTFVSLPGMNSFYLWSGLNPPTGLNATSWMYLLDSGQQQTIVDAVRHIRRLCLISNPAVLSGWEGSGPPPRRPLFVYESSGWSAIYSNDGYTISVRSHR